MKKSLIAAMMMFSVLAGGVPQSANAIILGLTVASGGIATGLLLGFGAGFTYLGLAFAPTRPGFEALLLGMILNQNGGTPELQSFDFQSDIALKEKLGVYDSAQAQEIRTGLAQGETHGQLVQVDLQGLSRAQAIQAMVAQTGINAPAADYLLDLNGLASN